MAFRRLRVKGSLGGPAVLVRASGSVLQSLHMNILDGVNGPGDLSRLSVRQLHRLAEEIRGLIVEVVERNGGHLASNLGVVELTIALHRVFRTPVDSIVWDVGHQCYAHKILTGRRDAFRTIRRSGGLSGFPKRSESPHDAFDAGHATTSMSAALGILAGNRALGKGGSVIAVIGDGALTGGMAYEAMSHAGQLGLPLIVVLNDNSMSISANVGAVSRYLSRLSATVRYQKFRRAVDRGILMVPLFGTRLLNLVVRAKRSVKALFFKEGLFAELGFEYAGPIDGHNIAQLCEVLSEARDIRKPVVVHVVTKKGKGHDEAEEDPASWHGVAAAPAAAEVRPASSCEERTAPALPPAATFTEAFGSALADEAALDGRIVAITAAMAKGTGLSRFQKAWPARCFDVGIAEEHAVTFAAGLAAAGARPVVAVYSTFMQRAFDQVHHDVAMENLPVVFALDRAGAVPDDGETHQGIYDIQAFRAVPGLALLAPASQAELRSALRWALCRDGPSMIRFPKAACPAERPAYAEPFVEGRGVLLREPLPGAGILLVGAGPLAEHCVLAAGLLARQGIKADACGLRFLKPVDREWLLGLAMGYRLVVFAEEGVLTGSVSADLAALVRDRLPGCSAVALGFDESPMAQATRDELLARAGLDAEGIAAAARKAMAESPEPEAAG